MILDKDFLECMLGDAWRDLLEAKEIKVCRWESDRGYEVDVTYNKYINETLCSQGMKQEGDAPQTYDTAIGAIGAYIEALSDYVTGHPKDVILVWRKRPELTIVELRFEGNGPVGPNFRKDSNLPPRYYVSSRLVFIPEGTEITRSIIVSA